MLNDQNMWMKVSNKKLSLSWKPMNIYKWIKKTVIEQLLLKYKQENNIHEQRKQQNEWTT